MRKRQPQHASDPACRDSSSFAQIRKNRKGSFVSWPEGPAEGLEAPAGRSPGLTRTELEGSCTQQRLTHPHAPSGMARMRSRGRPEGRGEDGKAWLARRSERCYGYTQTADRHGSRQQEGQSGQDLPITSRPPPERRERPSHPTQREEEVEERERENRTHM